jgi:methionine aminotransferase
MTVKLNLLCNAKPIRIALNDDYTTNWDRIEQACSSKTKMIIINNPHNPTGKILSHADFEALEQLMDKFQTIPTFR